MQRPTPEFIAAHNPGQNDAYAQGWSRTVVPRAVAVWLSVVFCAGLVVVPLVDGLLGSWRVPVQEAKDGFANVLRAIAAGGFGWRAVVDANNAALGTIEKFESSLEDSSALAASLRPGSLDLLLRFGGAGSEEAYLGREGWIFYRPDVDALVMDTVKAEAAATGIAEFAAQLAARGIRLVVVPVPGKASIHPEKLAPAGSKFLSAPVSPALSGLAQRLANLWDSKNVGDPSTAPRVFETTDLLWRRKTESGEAQFLRTDSHWAPDAMRAVAEGVAGLAAAPVVGGQSFNTSPRQIAAAGDTALMLDLPASSPLLERQHVTIDAVASEDGEPWQPDRDSPVLVLGDSYTNIYSSEDLGWGANAGFAEQLSRALGYRVDKLARNDAGALSARTMLAAEAVRNPGWLEGKKVVVWVMAAREFVHGHWSAVDIFPPVTGAGKFYIVPPDQTVDVEGTIRNIGSLPSPGNSPYADFLTAVHLTDLRDAVTGRAIPGDALAYLFTMCDRQVLPMPGLTENARVKLRLSNYAEKADKLDTLNRGEIDDVEIMMQEPNLAEWIAPLD